MTDFDPSLYARAPRLDLASTISLARTLVAAAPEEAPAFVARAKTRLDEAATTAAEALAERQRQEGRVSEEDRRETDLEADRAWSSLRKRLEGYADLPASRHPRAARAKELLAILFRSEGLSFLSGPYIKQLATAGAVLGRIDKDGLAADLDALAGPEFLAEIRHTHAAYEAMVSASLRSGGEGAQVNLSEQRRALSRAIAAYATKVCATVEEDEPETLARAREALRPIDAVRGLASRGAGGEGEAEAESGEVSSEGEGEAP